MMVEQLYEALREAGASEEKAKAAAIAAAAQDDRLSVEQRFGKIDADLGVLKWISATNSAMLLALLFKVFV